MGLFDDAIIELNRRADGTSSPVPLPFERLSTVLGGGLWPGHTLIAGPTAAGKTQLLLSIAAHAAGTGVQTTLVMPPDRSIETAARLTGLLTGRPWSALLVGGGERLDTAAIDALPLSTNRTDEDARLVVSDGGALPRRPTDQAVVTTVSIKLDEPPRTLATRPANALLTLVDDEETARTADAVVIMLPIGARSRDTWSTVRLAVAKVRHGVPNWVDVRFDGTRFEEESEEMELALE